MSRGAQSLQGRVEIQAGVFKFWRCDGHRAVLGASRGFLAGLSWERGRKNQFSHQEKGLWVKVEPQEMQIMTWVLF